MDDQRPEDATKLAALPRHSAMPWICVADPRQQMRTFLAETLQDLGCVTRECADVAELGAELDLRPPTQSVNAAEPSPVNTLELWYQPKIDTGTLALSGV